MKKFAALPHPTFKMKFISFYVNATLFFAVGLFFWAWTIKFKQAHTSELENGDSKDSQSEVIQRIETLLMRVEALNYELDEMLQMFRGSSPIDTLKLEPFAPLYPTERSTEMDPSDNENENSIGLGPLESFANLIGSIEDNLKELGYTIRVLKSNNFTTKPEEFAQIQDLYRTLRSHFVKLKAADGFNAFRESETKELANLVQGRLRILQNPKDSCGFACQIHHVCYCLIVAYATGRTMILKSGKWSYSADGWKAIFLPVSDTCTNYGTNESAVDFGHPDSEKHTLVSLAVVDFLEEIPNYLPISTPEDIANRLEKVHGEPHIWWVGQFLKYLLKLRPEFQKAIDGYIANLGITFPTVGIHVRRTDKIDAEASFHSLKEYMDHVDEYFDIMAKNNGSIRRSVFIASDFPGVISEAVETYRGPEWNIIGDIQNSKSASLSSRYSNESLVGIIKDVFALAHCDFLVCTFSSQFCRLAYELMQTKHADASRRFVSLDDVYYYGGGNGLIQIVAASHKPRNSEEIELRINDTIRVAGNHWNGMSKGTNERTKKTGLYPSYKAKNLIPRVKIPLEKWWLLASPAE